MYAEIRNDLDDYFRSGPLAACPPRSENRLSFRPEFRRYGGWEQRIIDGGRPRVP
jgi:hypothetical protein